MATRNRYTLEAPVKAAFLHWWHRLSDANAAGSLRADRAALRRCTDLTAVACTPAYQRIYRDLAAAHGGEPWQNFERERLAALVGLAAHVSDSSTMSLPQAMSHKADGGETRNPVSDLRFMRLLDAPDIEALFTGLRRCLPLIQHRVDPASLADDIFGWGDGVKKRWAYAYAWPDKADR